MGNYISSEHLKHKNTFAKKLVWLAPILTFYFECTCSHVVSTKFV